MSYTRVNDRVYSGLGGDTTLDALLATSKDVGSIAQRASAGAAELANRLQGLTSDDLNERVAAYQFAYTQTAGLIQTVTSRPEVKKWLDLANKTYATAVQDVSFIEQLKDKSGKLDASGVADVMMLVKSNAKTVVSMAVAVGLNPQTAETINDMIGIGAGCVAGIAAGTATPFAIGSAVAAIGCAVALIFKVLANQYAPVTLPSWVKREVFTPLVQQQAYLQTDAVRLAACLHAYYGCDSFEGDVLPLLLAPRGYTAPDEPAGMPSYIENYPPRPPGASDTPESTIPAVSGRELLLAMTDLRTWGTPAYAEDNLRNTLNVVAWVMYFAGLQPPVDNGAACGIFQKLEMFDDVNVTAISIGAAIGRAVVALRGDAMYGYEGRVFDMSPFIRAEELIHYFMAITYREHEKGLHAEVPYLKFALPVRQYAATSENKAYSPTCWTSLFAGGGPCRTFGDAQSLDLLSRVGRREYAAMKEFAFIRVLAAFSQMLNTWWWTQPTPVTPNTRADLIAEIAKEPMHNYQKPVDPRQVLPAPSQRAGWGGWVFNSNVLSEVDAPVQNVVLPLAGIHEHCNAFDANLAGRYTVPFKGHPDCAGECSGLEGRHLPFEPVRNGRRLAGYIGEMEARLGPVIDEAQQRATAETPRYAFQMLQYGPVTINAAATPGTPEYEAAQKLNPLLLGAAAFLLIKLLK